MFPAMKRETPLGNTWEGPWQDKNRSLDLYDVAYWFFQDPFRCVNDPRARKELRSYEQTSRPWYGSPRREEMAERQNIRWWEDLQNELLLIGVPRELAPLFADYLGGFALVRERDQSKIDPDNPTRVTAEWRRTKRFEKELGFSGGPTLRPPGRQHLRTTILGLMEDQLASVRGAWKRQFCGRLLSKVWALIDEEISPTSELADQTVARSARRARQRNRREKKS
jgi:hypothetical protein